MPSPTQATSCECAGLDAVFKPRSVAIIGATPRKGSIGHTVLHNIMASDFNGVVYPVHPQAPFIHSIKAYRSVLDIPDPVDLAVIIVPWKHVTPVARGVRPQGRPGADRDQRGLPRDRRPRARGARRSCWRSCASTACA